jgi:hypothetical protein
MHVEKKKNWTDRKIAWMPLNYCQSHHHCCYHQTSPSTCAIIHLFVFTYYQSLNTNNHTTCGSSREKQEKSSLREGCSWWGSKAKWVKTFFLYKLKYTSGSKGKSFNWTCSITLLALSGRRKKFNHFSEWLFLSRRKEKVEGIVEEFVKKRRKWAVDGIFENGI